MGFLNTIFGGSQRPPSERIERVLPPVVAQSLENPSTPLSEIGNWGEFLGLPGTNDDWMPPVSERTAMACSAVYRCVTLEAGVIAGLPLKIYRLSADGQREELPNHRLMPLLQTAPFPGRALTAFSWRELWGVNMLLWGNHYSAIRYDNAGRVIGFDAYMPWQVQVVRLPGKRGINFYVCTDDDGNSEVLHQEDMLHIPGPGFDGIKGLSRIQSFARGSVGLARSMEERTGRVHQNASMPSGVMQVPGKMSDPAFKRLRRQLEEAHTGVANWGKTVIADEGSKYTPFQLSPQDLQTIEARRYQVADISRFFGVPLHLLNETDKTTSWGTGLSENTLAYLIFSLDADLRRIESELNYKLFSGTRVFAEFDRDGLLSMDPAKTASVMQSEISSGVSTINEARRKKNRPPVKGGDTPLINSTNVPLTTQAAKGPDNAPPVPQPSPGQQE